MPSPRAEESKKDYIARFMKSSEASSDFPDEKQRLAVAYSMFEKRNAGPLPYGQDHPWPKAYKCSFIEPGVVFYQDLGGCQVCGDKMSCGNSGDTCQPTGETVLVKQDALAKMAQSFVGKPVINKVHEDVKPSTVADGDADGIVTRVWLDEKSGWWMCEFLVWDMATQRNCESAAYSVSCAYEPTAVDEDGGEYHNIPYAQEIADGEYTHLAIVTNPRYEGARIYVNSKGGSMSWRFWEKGARKNAAPLDPKTEMVDVDGKQVPLQNLYDALDEEKPRFNDDTVLETPRGEKTLGALKENYRNKAKQNADKSCPTCGQAKANAEGDGEKHPLPDLRKENDQAADAAKEIAKEPLEKKPLELEQKRNAEASTRDELDAVEAAAKKNAADEEAKELEKKNADAKSKADEDEKKNAEAKADEEMRQAEEKALIEKRNAGRKAFAALRNARGEGMHGDAVKVTPVSSDERLAKGKAKYGSAS